MSESPCRCTQRKRDLPPPFRQTCYGNELTILKQSPRKKAGLLVHTLPRRQFARQRFSLITDVNLVTKTRLQLEDDGPKAISPCRHVDHVETARRASLRDMKALKISAES